MSTPAASELPGPVAGIDEAGRGPLAGPVVAAAVILPARYSLAGLDDSKKLTAAARDRLYGKIVETAACACISGPVERIDRDNILAATLWAMAQAVETLTPAPCLVLVDGNKLPPLPFAARAIVKGDGRCLSIAAASIVAKVTRDRIMADLAAAHPGYGWERNKGYGTREHADALQRLGPTPHHRRSFKPIQQIELDI